MLNSWHSNLTCSSSVLAGVRATSLSCRSSNRYSTLSVSPANDFSNITGAASVLQKPKFTLITHAFNTKFYKMDSDLSKTITKVKVFWSLKVKKIPFCFTLLVPSANFNFDLSAIFILITDHSSIFISRCQMGLTCYLWLQAIRT